MRLRLFDRIRRLTRRRAPARPPDSDSPGAAQGRHRRRRRPESPDVPSTTVPSTTVPSTTVPSARSGPSGRGLRGPAPWSTSSAPPATLAPPPRPVPGGPSFAGADGFSPSGTSLAPGSPAVPGQWPGTGPDAGSRRAGRVSGSAAAGGGAARARIREAPADAAPVGVDEAARSALGRPYAPRPHGGGRSLRAAGAALRTRLPFAAPHSPERPLTADGRRNCGSIERILWRQWDTAAAPPAEAIEAVDRLAELPEAIKEKLAEGLDAIFIGPGGVPQLDDMTSLRGVALPGGRATWDACAGAYGERKIVVGSQPSPTPDVMCHEVGHALDDLDSPAGKWQSDSAEFRMLYDQCQPHLASDFHRQPGGLGRKEFFADAFAAIASRQRPALVDMLRGDTRTALRIMLYFNRRYGI